MQSENFLFWNVNASRKFDKADEKISYLNRIILEEKPDIVCLAEHNLLRQRLIDLYGQERTKIRDRFCFITSPNTLINFNPDAERYTQVVALKSDLTLSHRVMFCHLLDKWHFSEADRLLFVQQVIKLQPLFIMGDFNLEPFEAGMIHPLAFNSYGIWDTKPIFSSTFQSIKKPTYFNPFWSLYGRDTKIYNPKTRRTDILNQPMENYTPLGTYKKQSKNENRQIILDQVLIRMDTLDQYIRCTIFHHGLAFSDHAPIMLTLQSTEEKMNPRLNIKFE